MFGKRRAKLAIRHLLDFVRGSSLLLNAPRSYMDALKNLYYFSSIEALHSPQSLIGLYSRTWNFLSTTLANTQRLVSEQAKLSRWQFSR